MNSPAKYFHDEWWEMLDLEGKKAREIELRKDLREVWDEMICQDYAEGMPMYMLCQTYKKHRSTIWRIIKEEK